MQEADRAGAHVATENVLPTHDGIPKVVPPEAVPAVLSTSLPVHWELAVLSAAAMLPLFVYGLVLRWAQRVS